MWQLMFGGVFDRHPNLKLVMSEVRADWLPAVLAHLDARYDRYRDQLPARCRPSDYWRSHCLAGASFMHKAEVEMRHDIGVEQILFGRDYPHPEGTWPNTPDWLRDAFAGVPEDELRLMLGENAYRFFDLERAPLEAIAARIGYPSRRHQRAGRHRRRRAPRHLRWPRWLPGLGGRWVPALGDPADDRRRPGSFGAHA